MNERCQFCIDPKCERRKDCNCESCDKNDTCYRTLKPTVRITLKCTQSCSHCCWESSPALTNHMSLDVARDIHQFFSNNPIHSANIMGGEFWLHPEWEDVIGTIVDGLHHARLVTNGDWVASEKSSGRVKAFMQEHEHCYLAITSDRWHNNKHTAAAEAFCKKHDFLHWMGGDEDDKSIVPVGRSELSYSNTYSMFSCYCHNPERMYSFLIDEKGIIYKCPFGSWDYAEVRDHLEGGFCERFVECNAKFYKAFVPNCASCRRAYQYRLNQDKAEANA